MKYILYITYNMTTITLPSDLLKRVWDLKKSSPFLSQYQPRPEAPLVCYAPEINKEMK